MRALVLEGMRAGAVGFATSTSPAHNGHGGLPMPSRLADEAELRALVGALKEAGRGVFMLTKGGHTKVSFLEELAADSGAPGGDRRAAAQQHQPARGVRRPRRDRAANARGRRLLGAISCCPLSMDFTLHSPYTFEGLESWQPALPLKGAAYEAKLKDKGFRDAVRAELVAAGALSPVQRRNGTRSRWWSRRDKDAEQRSIGELARAAGKDPLDFMLDLALGEKLDTVFNAMLLNSDEAAVGEMLRHPASLVSLSDAGAHLTFFNDAGFGLHLLGHWVRERGALHSAGRGAQAHERARAALRHPRPRRAQARLCR